MTKARARERAKAKAGQKAQKRKAAAEQSAQQDHQGHIGPKNNSISSPVSNASGQNLAAARRGAARSR